MLVSKLLKLATPLSLLQVSMHTAKPAACASAHLMLTPGGVDEF